MVHIFNDSVCRSMGGDMSEASEFDRVMQSMSEGTYSSSSAMETFPVSWMSVTLSNVLVCLCMYM